MDELRSPRSFNTAHDLLPNDFASHITEGPNMIRQPLSLSRALLCALAVLCFTATAHAQFRAGVQGTVTDTAGAVVPGATVTLTNKETSRAQQTTTSDEGFYRFSQLAPGQYTL